MTNRLFNCANYCNSFLNFRSFHFGLRMTDVLNPQNLAFISGLDINDPEYTRQLLRPADIKEDVKLMEQRRRVTLILRSPAFRKELEKIVASQMRDGVLSPNVMALKQLVDMLTPHAKLGSSAFSKGMQMPGFFKQVPINIKQWSMLFNFISILVRVML